MVWYYVYNRLSGTYIACSLEAQLTQFDPGVYAWTTIMPPDYDWMTQHVVWTGSAWSVVEGN